MNILLKADSVSEIASQVKETLENAFDKAAESTKGAYNKVKDAAKEQYDKITS